MPFFKFRRGDASSALPTGAAAQVESVEAIRKRARHRLIGTAVLVLLGVVVFPLLFDTQPRPVSVDIPIEIPGKNTVRPLVAPVRLAPTEKISAAGGVSVKEEVLLSRSQPVLVAPVAPVVKNEVRPEPKREAKSEVKSEARAEAKSEAKPVIKWEAKPAVKLEGKSANADSTHAAVLLKGAGTSPPPKPSAAQLKNRTVIQVGAFSDDAKAQEARLRLERAGLKTYTQIVNTKEGKRIRVRLGPFASKAEAEKASEKVRALDLPVGILTF